MIDERRQLWGIVGALLPIPALCINGISFFSRYFSSAAAPLGGAFIPDSSAAQLFLLAALPVLGLLSSMWAYGAAHDGLSKTGLILNAFVLLAGAFLLFGGR